MNIFSINKYIKNTISQYGLLSFLKIIIFEILYFRFNKQLDFSFAAKKFSSKNIEYVPTPYYLLYLIKKNLPLPQINKYDLVDFGCGKGRVYNYFKSYINFFIGIDIIKEYKENFNTSSRFVNVDCRNINKLQKQIKHYKKKKILFFFKPFDDNLILKILKQFMQQNDIAVVINPENQNKIKNYKIIYSKKFKSRNKSINIIKLKKINNK